MNSPTDRRAADERIEIWLVLGLSLGQSAVYAVISLIGSLTAGAPLAQQQVTVNASVDPRPYLDLTYQLAGIVFTLMPVALVLWLLRQRPGGIRRAWGLTPLRPARSTLLGIGLAALIGLPGLALYVVGRAAGITVDVVPTALGAYWWTVPVLILQAAKNAVLEEVIVVGYLLTRLRGRRWGWPAAIAASALLRGSYHLYQGFGPFLGNVAMGVVFALWFRRTGRIAELLVAHTVIDAVAFVGYPWASTHLLADGLPLKST